jgi:hypothetical protein
MIAQLVSRTVWKYIAANIAYGGFQAKISALGYSAQRTFCMARLKVLKVRDMKRAAGWRFEHSGDDLIILEDMHIVVSVLRGQRQ